MRYVVAALLPLLPSLACAATTATISEPPKTTWNPADKSPDIALSNGNLTAAVTANNWRAVRATVAKYHGKWCYQLIVEDPVVNLSFGFANDLWPYDASDGEGWIGGWLPPLDKSINGIGYASNGIERWWNDVTNTGSPVVQGKTGESCVDLDQEPPRVWITADVDGTTGLNGGPLWNGSATADPATNTGGKRVFLPRYGFFPAFNGSRGDRITAKFGSFVPPAGFNTWNTAGGEPSIPGPASPLTVNIANAPAWQPGHAYTLTHRMVAGPAYNGSNYADGQPLCLFAVKTAGVSGSSFNAFDDACASGKAADFGGGLDGNIPSQWAGAATVTDGSVTWALLSKVDYITLTAAFADDATQWAPNTQFGNNQVINKDRYSYVQRSGSTCTSGTSWEGAPGLDNTCNWQTYNFIHPTHIGYSSLIHRWPHFSSLPNGAFVQMAFDYDTKFKVWYGGARRTEYISGMNDETQPMLSHNHNLIFAAEGYGYCKGWGDLPYGDFNHFNRCAGDTMYHAIVSPAPGDGFADNPGPLRYDSSRGVAFYTDSTQGDYPGLGNFRGDQPYGQGDTATVSEGIQIKSLHGVAANGGFASKWVSNILDAGGPFVYYGCCETLINNVLISRSTAPGAMGVFEKYHNPFNQNTVVGSGAQNSVMFGPGIPGWNQAVPIETIKNNLSFGFTYPFARNWDESGIYHGEIVTWPSPQNNGGNASDVAPPATDVTFDNPNHPYGYSGPWRTQAITGYDRVGLDPADVFINPTIGPDLDLRLKPNSTALGAGVASDPRDGRPHDILGRTRIASYDPGAYQAPKNTSPPSPRTGSLINTIQLCSTSGSTVPAKTPSPPMFALEFKKGDIPAEQYPQLQAEDGTPWGVTFINIRHWSDGSMKIAGVLPGPFPKAIPTDCTNAKILNGGSASTLSGLSVAQLYNEQIRINANGFDGALGASLGFTGNWSAKLTNDANNGEVVNYGDGQGGRVYRILTHVQQNGTPHGQMEVYTYVQQLRDADGGVAGHRILPRLTQPWYNIDNPAKDWRGLRTFNIQYGAEGTTISPPYPAADKPLAITASNWRGGADWSVTVPNEYNSCGSGSQQSCKLAGYLTADSGSSLPSGVSANTIYCADTFPPTQIRFGQCPGGAALNIATAGTGTFTFHPIALLPHFGTLWGARADGRYTYIPGSVAEDAPILVKGNPVYEQSTKLWPPYDMSITPDSNPSTFFSGGPVQWDLMTIGPIIQNVDQGGERDEIGARNAWCARAFYNRSTIDDKWVRLLGLVQKQFPAHVRDVTTRGLINLGDPAKSYAGFPASMANTFKWSGVEGASGFTPPLHGAPSMFGFASDNSHMPDFAGCAYLMTGEPQYLDLQAEWANQTLMSQSIEERNPIIDQTTYYGGLTYNSGWGIRLMAWSLRPFVDVDAWWPDVDPAGTQAHQYFHDIEQTSTLLPQLTIALQNNWSKENCFWVPPGGGNRNPWMLNYMNTIMVSAYNANEDPNALWFLNCSATWYNHSFAAFGNYFNLYAGDEKAYDTGAIGSRGSLNITSAHFSWADGTATVTLDNPSETAELFDGEMIYVSAAGYDPNAPHNLTRTSAITATFPLTSNPGATVGGTFQAVGKVIGSDAMYSHAGPPPTNLYQIAWNPGTPGSFAEAYNTSAGVASWNPANGDKFIFSPYIPVLAGQVPGGLLSAKPYYVVNMHKGDNCGMIWSAGTLTVTTCAAHGLAIGESYIIGINETDVPGLAYQGNYGSTLSPGPFLSNCQATGAKYFTCPVAANPGSGSQFGKFNTANLAESPGGPPLAISDANSMNPNAWDGWVAADSPAGYWVDYPWNGGYLALALNALNGMIASGVPGLAGYKADADYRFGYLLARFGMTANGFWGNNPKNAMSTCFGLC